MKESVFKHVLLSCVQSLFLHWSGALGKCMHSVSVHYGAEADVGVNCDSAPPRQWKTYLEKKVVRMSHVYLFFSVRMKKREEDRTRWSHYPESCGPRKAWKLGFVPRRRKSEGDIFLTWMFLNLISKQRGSQRAVCLSLAKHNITQPCRPSHSVGAGE